MILKKMRIIGHNTPRTATDHIVESKIVLFRVPLDADMRNPKMLAPSIPWSNYQKRDSEKLTSSSGHATVHSPS